MRRREFIKQVGLGLGALCVTNSVPCFSKPQAAPNILFIFADDQCHEALSAFGSEVQTPNLDRLVRRGVSFRNAYNQGAWNGAVCIASRTMFNTGRYLWHAEALDRKLAQEKGGGATVVAVYATGWLSHLLLRQVACEDRSSRDLSNRQACAPRYAQRFLGC